MNQLSDGMTGPAWHRLLGPLPDATVPERQPVLPPEIAATPDGAALAGWERLTVHLSAPGGLRIVLVTLDADGRLLAASDAVLYRRSLGGGPAPADCDAPALVEQRSIGGRFEPDGSFRGTRWDSTTIERGGEAGAEDGRQSTRSEPSEAEIAALRALVATMILRQPARD
jgi:hypothetical protein